jgi:alkaline phosphatase D
MSARKNLGLLIVSIFVFFVSVGTSQRLNSPKQNDKPIVVMISIDGFRNDYLQKLNPPTLNKLASEGTNAQGIIPSFPSLTFPNHVTLVTGMAPGHHGIVSNFFYDKERKAAYQMNDLTATNDGSWYRGEPLWTVAEKSGMLAATCFWVGSEAKIGGIDPTYIRPYDGTLPNKSRVDQVIQWLQLPDDQRPHFISLYFSDVDSMGHKFGPDSNEVKAAVTDIDSAIGNLVQWADQSGLPIQFVVVSDHGMLTIKEQIDITPLADLKDFTSMERGATTLLYANDPTKIDVTYEALKKAQKNFRVFRQKDLPANWKYSDDKRVGDLVLVADPGYYLVRQEGFTDAPPRTSVATHGWDPDTTEQMKGLFIARGSMIRSGLKIAAFKNTDVYPMVLNLLGLISGVANDSNPNVLKPILKK